MEDVDLKNQELVLERKVCEKLLGGSELRIVDQSDVISGNEDRDVICLALVF